MWFTDATIAFVKEIISNREILWRENAELEGKLLYYEGKLNQCNMAAENLSEEFRKSMYVNIEPDEDMQKPVLLDEAIVILTERVNDLREELTNGKEHEELTEELFDKLTNDYFPGILDEI